MLIVANIIFSNWGLEFSGLSAIVFLEMQPPPPPTGRPRPAGARVGEVAVICAD